MQVDVHYISPSPQKYISPLKKSPHWDQFFSPREGASFNQPQEIELEDPCEAIPEFPLFRAAQYSVDSDPHRDTIVSNDNLKLTPQSVIEFKDNPFDPVKAASPLTHRPQKHNVRLSRAETETYRAFQNEREAQRAKSLEKGKIKTFDENLRIDETPELPETRARRLPDYKRRVSKFSTVKEESGYNEEQHLRHNRRVSHRKGSKRNYNVYDQDLTSTFQAGNNLKQEEVKLDDRAFVKQQTKKLASISAAYGRRPGSVGRQTMSRGTVKGRSKPYSPSNQG